ncbi:MAG: hypothetical protein ACRBHB_03320 [Arenicella sp.]
MPFSTKTYQQFALWALFICLFCAQTSNYQHSIEHHFHEHEHEISCDYFATVDNSPLTFFQLTALAPQQLELSKMLFQLATNTVQISTQASIRAPPNINIS